MRESRRTHFGEPFFMRLAYCVSMGDGEQLRRYLVACLPAGSRLEPVRKAIRHFPDDFAEMAYERFPWLSGESAGASAANRILEACRSAGARGVTLSGLAKAGPDRDQALEGLIRDGQVIREHRRTGGRPVDVYRLAEHADGVTPADHDNPFAFRPAPLL